MHTDEVFDVEFDAPPPHRRRRAGLVILASMVGVIAVVVGLVASADDADGPDVTADADRETDGVVTVRIESAGRVDGLDSLRMPMVASPDDGLVDGQTVTVSAAGFTPNITVAAVQCAGIAGSFGGENDCDVGNYTLDSSSDAGEIAFTVTVRRYVSTSQGQVDCANPGEHQCVIAVANISDYDESATANVWFDAAVDGERRPALVVSKIDGLDDGEMVTVTGSGFPAEASVVVGECVVGGGWSIFGCWEEDARLADVTTDADGGFVVDVAVRRVVFNGGDCVGNVYGCRISARSTLEPFVLGDGTAANPVRVWFDGTTMPSDIERGVALSLIHI